MARRNPEKERWNNAKDLQWPTSRDWAINIKDVITIWRDHEIEHIKHSVITSKVNTELIANIKDSYHWPKCLKTNCKSIKDATNSTGLFGVD